MRRVNRTPADIGTVRHLAVLLALRRDVVVIVAERFPVRSIPEQTLITAVRHDVVDDQADAAGVGLRRAIHAHRAGVEQAPRLALAAELIVRLGEEVSPCLLPCPCVSALAGGWAAVLLAGRRRW